MLFPTNSTNLLQHWDLGTNKLVMKGVRLMWEEFIANELLRTKTKMGIEDRWLSTCLLKWLKKAGICSIVF